ncbi:UPF0158 family protein [Lacrimispora sp. BS-2]|uniref:UPF0158 family protein n=1 Tax=Lacrimispora sp. BS-2 TaxID=3151850 RepID=A0AAU7PQX2_9FIRM
MKINLSVVLDAIEMADDNYTYFLDIETGESVFLADELITGLDNERLEDEIEENPDRYLRFPTKFEIHQYHIMEEFVWSLPEGRRQDLLERAIRGRGAFRRFKDTVYDLGLEKKWFQYEVAAYSKIAIDWCRDNGIGYYE